MKQFHISKTKDSAPSGFGILTNHEVFQVIRDAIAIANKMLTTQFLCRGSKREYLEPRVFFQLFMRKYTNYSLTQIGYYSCPDKPYDHSDIRHNVEKMYNDMKLYENYSAEAERLDGAITASLEKFNKEKEVKGGEEEKECKTCLYRDREITHEPCKECWDFAKWEPFNPDVVNQKTT